MIRSLLFSSLFATILAATPSLPAVAQSGPGSPSHRPAMLRMGLGGYLNGSGDYGVTKLHLEYAPQYGQHFRLGYRLALVSGSEAYDFDYVYSIPQSYRALNLEQEAYWVPFGVNKAVEFSVGIGAYEGYSKEKGWSVASLDEMQKFSYVATDNQGFHVGYITSLNLDVALNQERTWRIGGRASLQNDTRANVLLGGQFQISRAW